MQSSMISIENLKRKRTTQSFQSVFQLSQKYLCPSNGYHLWSSFAEDMESGILLSLQWYLGFEPNSKNKAHLNLTFAPADLQQNVFLSHNLFSTYQILLDPDQVICTIHIYLGHVPLRLCLITKCFLLFSCLPVQNLSFHDTGLI